MSKRAGAVVGFFGLLVIALEARFGRGPLRYGWAFVILAYAATALGLHRVVRGVRQQPYLVPRIAISMLGALLLIVVVAGIVTAASPEY